MIPSYEVLVTGINLKPLLGSFGYSSITLIRSGDASILFDTGSYGLRGFLKETMKTIDITAVVLSHLHYDHCSNVDLFPDVPVYLSRSELDFFQAPSAERDADIYRPFQAMMDSISLNIFTSDIDIAPGVKLIHTPGHTPGHCSLEVLTSACPVLIAGDAVKTSSDWFNEFDAGNAHSPSVSRETKKQIKMKYSVVVSGHQGELRHGIAMMSDTLVSF